MATSKIRWPDTAYVWTWLPGETEPVAAGAVEQDGPLLRFIYANSYLARPNAISLYGPELPLRSGVIDPLEGLNQAGAIRDGSPDAWGRSVIQFRRRLGENDIPEIGYMLESGTNRFGANDFQEGPTNYLPRADSTPLDELAHAAMLAEEGRNLSVAMAEALLHGTTIGGARPKVLVHDPDDGSEWIAKLSAASDRVFSVVNAEATCLELARRAGIRVPDSKVTKSKDRSVLLVRRFDRTADGGRRHVVSGLTVVGLDEMQARYATYPALLEPLRAMGTDPVGVGAELFERIAFSIAIGNSDDHARNHAAFWDGHHLDLTPAYDLAPGQRSGETATQAMAFDVEGRIKQSNFAALLTQARIYGLTQQDARERIDRLVSSIRENWGDAADVGELNQVNREYLWGLQILNLAAFYDYV
jgi:serine/threonine-protein kinase HipA